MGVLAKIFGTDSVIKKTTEGIYNGVDNVFYTDQEKASDFLTLLKAYEPFKLAQRVIAFMLIGVFLLTWLLAVVLFAVSGITDSIGLYDTATHLGSLNNETLGLPVTIVVGFYFGGGALEGVVNRFNKKAP